MGSILPWGPQAHWQKIQVFKAFQKNVKMGTNLISVGMMLHGEGATTEKAYLLGPIRWISLGKEAHNILCFPTLVGWVDVIRKRWSFK